MDFEMEASRNTNLPVITLSDLHLDYRQSKPTTKDY